jgi:hypothetical protein
MFTKDNGKTIRLMVKVYIFIKMELHIQDNGLKIFNGDMEYKNGLMVHRIKGKRILIIIRNY